MRVRVGYIRAMLAVLATGVLVLPVGVSGPDGPRAIDFLEALTVIAHARFGVTILEGLSAGGALASGALLRFAICALAWVGFWVTGFMRAEPAVAGRDGRMRCPSCGFVTAQRMSVCPRCGARTRD